MEAQLSLVCFLLIGGKNMNLKRVFAGFAVLLICAVAAVQDAHATPAENFLIRTYRIEVAVESLDAALPRILSMPGIDLQSELNFQAGSGRFERLVQNHELAAALSALRGIGQVSGISSSTRNEFAQFNGLQSEFRIRNGEYRNLTDLLHSAENLTDFRIIESRLVGVIAEIESIRGRMNYLNSEMGTTRLHITVSTIPEEAELEDEPEEYGTFQRIGNAFMRSARFTGVVIQAFVLVLAYMSIPLGSAVLAGIGLWRFLRGKNKKPESGDRNEKK